MNIPRNHKIFALLFVITVPLIGSASADAATTALTLTVISSTPPNALSISAPTSLSLGTNVSFPSTYTTVFNTDVTVSDTRLSTPTTVGWTATASVSDLTPTTGPVIPASVFSYSPGTITKNYGTGTLAGFSPTVLNSAATVVTAASVTAYVGASWLPTLTITEPNAPATGAYTGTVTHSVF